MAIKPKYRYTPLKDTPNSFGGGGTKPTPGKGGGGTVPDKVSGSVPYKSPQSSVGTTSPDFNEQVERDRANADRIILSRNLAERGINPSGMSTEQLIKAGASVNPSVASRLNSYVTKQAIAPSNKSVGQIEVERLRAKYPGQEKYIAPAEKQEQTIIRRIEEQRQSPTKKELYAAYTGANVNAIPYIEGASKTQKLPLSYADENNPFAQTYKKTRQGDKLFGVPKSRIKFTTEGPLFIDVKDVRTYRDEKHKWTYTKPATKKAIISQQALKAGEIKLPKAPVDSGQYLRSALRITSEEKKPTGETELFSEYGGAMANELKPEAAAQRGTEAMFARRAERERVQTGGVPLKELTIVTPKPKIESPTSGPIWPGPQQLPQSFMPEPTEEISMDIMTIVPVRSEEAPEVDYDKLFFYGASTAFGILSSTDKISRTLLGGAKGLGSAVGAYYLYENYMEKPINKAVDVYYDTEKAHKKHLDILPVPEWSKQAIQYGLYGPVGPLSVVTYPTYYAGDVFRKSYLKFKGFDEETINEANQIMRSTTPMYRESAKGVVKSGALLATQQSLLALANVAQTAIGKAPKVGRQLLAEAKAATPVYKEKFVSYPRVGNNLLLGKVSAKYANMGKTIAPDTVKVPGTTTLKETWNIDKAKLNKLLKYSPIERRIYKVSGEKTWSDIGINKNFIRNIAKKIAPKTPKLGNRGTAYANAEGAAQKLKPMASSLGAAYANVEGYPGIYIPKSALSQSNINKKINKYTYSSILSRQYKTPAQYSQKLKTSASSLTDINIDKNLMRNINSEANKNAADMINMEGQYLKNLNKNINQNVNQNIYKNQYKYINDYKTPQKDKTIDIPIPIPTFSGGGGGSQYKQRRYRTYWERKNPWATPDQAFKIFTGLNKKTRRKKTR